MQSKAGIEPLSTYSDDKGKYQFSAITEGSYTLTVNFTPTDPTVYKTATGSVARKEPVNAERDIGTANASPDTYLSLSPDGKKLAFVEHGEVFVSAVTGGDAFRARWIGPSERKNDAG